MMAATICTTTLSSSRLDAKANFKHLVTQQMGNVTRPEAMDALAKLIRLAPEEERDEDDGADNYEC